MGYAARVGRALCAGGLALACSHAWAYPNNNACGDISGYSGREAATCTSCHGGGSYSYSAAIGIASKVSRSSANAFTVQGNKLSGSTAVNAGFNLAVGAGAGTLTPGSGSQAVGTDEVAHDFPDSPDASGHFSFPVTWTAPATSGSHTFYACVNIVDGNRNGDCSTGMSGDSPVCTTKAVTVNALPVISGVDSTVGFTEGGSAVVVDGSITLSDADDTNLNRAEVEISANYQAGADTLACGTTTGISTCTFSAGLLTITGTATLATYDTVLQSVTFSNSSQDPSTLSRTIRIRVRDAFNEYSAYDSRVLGVTAVNDAPAISGVANVASYTENAAAVTVDGTVTITDADSTSLNQGTVSITGGFASGEDVLVCPSPAIPGIACSYNSGTGVLTLSGTTTLANYELALEDVGYQNTSDNPSTASRTLAFAVRDTGNLTSTADSTTLTVTAVNDAPAAAADATGIAKNSSGNAIDVLANDSDVEADALSITLVTAPSNGGSVTIQGIAPNQTLSYAPATNYSGVEIFDYTISDGALTATATVTVTVSTGSAPVANADSPAAVAEDSSANVFDVLANDTDADVGDTLTITQVNGSGTFPVATTHGSVTRSGAGPGNTLLYTPAANYAGSDAFTYTVEDAAGLSAAATVSVTVSAVNDAPSITAPASIAVTEDVASALTGISFADVDAASGSVTASFGVGSGALGASSGGGVTVGGSASALTLSGTVANLNTFIAGANLSFTTAADSTANVTLSVALSDGGNTGSGGSKAASPAAVTLTVTAVNDAPAITSAAVTTADDGQPYTYTLTVSDADDSSFSFGLSGEPAGMAISTDGVISWTPPCATTLDGYVTGTITASAADGGENGAAAATQSFAITVSAPDSDGDGMPNCYELAESFDPNDAADGALDRDGDGRSNAEEFAAGTDPDLDDVAPVVTAPADLVIAATGYVTTVALGEATASDTLSGALEATVDLAGPFRPGRHVLTWTAQDEAGNVASDTQQLDVLPLADFDVDQIASEGGSANLTVSLNGTPPQYPVTIDYTVGGVADASDSDAAAGTLVIASGLGATQPVALTADGVAEGLEALSFTLTGADQAVPGTRTTHTITISDVNVAPTVTLTALQGTAPRQFAYQGDGPMFVGAMASDPNGDILSYDWSGSDDGLGIDAATTDTVSFDPAALSGSYTLRVTVMDPANATAQAQLLVVVVAGTSVEQDVDADGILDGADSVTDYGAVLENQSGDPGSAELLETEPGLGLRKGRTALAAGRSGAMITMSDLVTAGVGGGGIAFGADSYDNIGGLFDFEIHGLAAGGSARVVLPLQTAIRTGAVYRKFDPASGWRDFVVDADNAVASAFSTLGQCPGPASGDYVAGLQPFADCVRLTLSDGGPNDADSTADGVIRDPGGVAAAGTSTDSGWGRVDGGAWTALLLLLGALWRIRSRGGRAVALALLLSAAPAAAADGSLHFGADLGAGYDGNLGNAEDERDVRESSVVTGGVNATYARALSLYSTLLLRASAAAEYYRSFDDLSNGKATGMVRLMHRANGDFFTPELAAWVAASYWEFGSDLRDSDEYRAGVFVRQQVTTRISGRLALGGVLRESDSRVFDTRGASASLNLDWHPALGHTLYTGYQFYRGDVVSTATTPGAFKIIQAAEVIEADDAFGGFATGQNAYRLDADAHVGTLGYNHAFSSRLSADLQGQYIDTRADYGNQYQRALAVLSLLARF